MNPHRNVMGKPMIANLSMYARPETHQATCDFWNLIRKNLQTVGVAAPSELSQEVDLMRVWQDPNLLLSQTCGMPYRNALHGKVQLVGTPIYDLEDCPDGYYFSVIVVRKDDSRTALQEFAQATFAFNEAQSQSGFAAALTHAAQRGVTFHNKVQSHSHANSAEMIANGQAEIAALDAVTWKLIKRYDAFAADLRVLARTTPCTPALPFITSRSQNAKVIFKAIQQAIQDLPPEQRDIMCLQGLVKISAQDYLKVPNPIP